MKNKFHYKTVSEAINELRKKGFDTDFNLDENCLICNNQKYNLDELEITEIYFYEGESDPGDEATVYGIQSKNGLKGILLVGAGSEMDQRNVETLRKLRLAH
ncbi:MAG: hypothetical protein R3277_11905 [Brumimicrobium sp.]|nr:hypothetical protein [Brumimicrobium sp.]